MRKHMTKLIVALMLLMISLAVAGAGTYAWLVLSTAPEIGGMQISIGGSDGHTILIAPDIAESTAGGTVHYPGKFAQTMNLAKETGYDYLENLRGLLPVSTADGLHWYIPAYDILEEGAQLKDITDFTEDTSLTYANQNADGTAYGNYLYFDFWVVAPSDQTLRVSTSLSQQDSAGTFVMVKPTAVKNEDGSFTLDISDTRAAACLRLGFLANEETDANALAAYQESSAYQETYRALKGIYQNAEQTIREGEAARFTIFEPNGDSHPANAGLDGSYVVTQPIGRTEEGLPQPVDISGVLTVQRSSFWAQNEDSSIKLGGMLDAAMIQAQSSGTQIPDGPAAIDYLLDTYLQNQLMGYITTGSFLHSTQGLYTAAGESGNPVAAELIDAMNAGATQDVSIVELTANVPQRIRMFIWLEGQDVDCTEAVQNSELIIHLELAGGTTS